MPWIDDGINDSEQRAAEDLIRAARLDTGVFNAVMDMTWVQDDITEAEATAIRYLYFMGRKDPAAMATIIAMPWFQDDIIESEARAIRSVDGIGQIDPTVMAAIIAMPWVQDNITEAETTAIRSVDLMGGRDSAAMATIVAMPWVQDDITKPEAEAIQYLRRIGREDPAAMAAIIAMPFLKSLDLDDVLALNALSNSSHDAKLDVILEHPTLRNGITDDLTTLVVAAAVIREAGEVRRMLNPGYADIEVLTEGTTLTPDLKISIVRTEEPSWDGAAQGLKYAVEFVESKLQAPLRVPHVIVVINDMATPGNSGAVFHWFAIGIHTRNEKPVQYVPGKDVLHSTYTHEVTSQYFNSDYMESWLTNGLATTFEYIYRLDGRAPSEVPQDMLQINRRGDCDAHNLKMHSERGESAQRSCNYFLGLGLFRELVETMGYDEYYAGLRRLYRLSLEARESGGKAGIAEVRQAFPDQAEIVEKHWSGKLNAPENR